MTIQEGVDARRLIPVWFIGLMMLASCYDAHRILRL